MDVRCQLATVVNLERCTSCDACSVACKAVWTSEVDQAHMYWVNVESQPGEGFPGGWQDQEKNRGGWIAEDGKLRLRIGGRLRILLELFHNPGFPAIEDYLSPWKYRFAKPVEPNPPQTAIVSRFTDELVQLEVSGDPDSVESRQVLNLPRFCNHCLNASCVAACPSGAIYKRPEDGVVLVDPGRCRGWKACVSACPYSKVFFNWATGKAEKCTYCAPLTGQGEQAVCLRNCPTGVFVSGPVLYDADRIHDVAAGEHGGGIDAIRELLLDPNESSVAAAARRNGIPERSLEEATESPVYSSIVDWKIAHPLHPEFRTLPMFFYIPPVGSILRGDQETGERLSTSPAEILKERHSDSEMLSQLFSAERPSEIELSLKRLLAIRAHRVALSGEGQDTKVAERWLTEAGLGAGDADRIAEAFKIGSLLE